MKSISFALTTRQFLDGSKTVTRRLNWRKLKAGDRLRGVEKAMGIPKGQKQVFLAVIEIVSVRREPLDSITADDVVREGFPEMTPGEFIGMFCEHMKCKPSTEVTRIEFKRYGTNA